MWCADDLPLSRHRDEYGGGSFDLWLSARSEEALEGALAEAIGYLTEAQA